MENNMYKLSVKQWNAFVGCGYHCKYCESSFQRQLKRQKHRCKLCYTYTPHEHKERLDAPLPITKYMEYIFTCSNGDIAFCSTEYLNRIIDRIKREPNKMFLIQSKNPITFNRVKFPKNVLLGTTIETNNDSLYREHKISNAPLPSKRYNDFLRVNHKSKMVTVEPVLDFDIDIMLEWIVNINPTLIWIGYDTKNNKLPEPTLNKTLELYTQLGLQHFGLLLKLMRKAWYEK